MDCSREGKKRDKERKKQNTKRKKIEPKKRKEDERLLLCMFVSD